MGFSIEFNALHLVVLYFALSLIGVLVHWVAGLLLNGPLDAVGAGINTVGLK